MFKKVEYVGFEGRPELKAQAEQLMPVLADEIRRWRDDVEVAWSPHPGTGDLDLMLSLTLPTGVSATNTGTFTPADLANGLRRASRCGWVWSDLLGLLSSQLMERI